MKIRSRWITKFLAWFVVTLLRGLFLTVRKEFQIAGNDFQLLAYRCHGDLPVKYLYCTWHDSIVMPLFMGKPHQMAALVSQHQDGSYLAELMRLLGIVCVRGSSKRGAVKALRESLSTAEDYHLTITPDGPRGPRRQMKDGIVYLASKSGRLIVAVSFECDHCWRVRGKWTDLVIPKPFSRVRMIMEAPIQIPPNLPREQIARFTELLQQRMDEAYKRAEQSRAA